MVCAKWRMLATKMLRDDMNPEKVKQIRKQRLLVCGKWR